LHCKHFDTLPDDFIWHLKMPSSMPTKQRINEEKPRKKEDPKTRKKTFQRESFEENAKGRRHHFLTGSFMAFLEQRSQATE